MRIGVAGMAGRMGRMVSEEVVASGAILSGGTARPGTAPAGLPILSDAAALVARSDVLIDVSTPEAVLGHADAVRAAGIAWVIGTTGLPDAAAAAIHQAARHVPVVWAANFSPGLTLVLALAERMARALPARDFDAEILELHHRAKRDAPSGTALALGEAVARGRGVRLEDVRAPPREQASGLRSPGAIGFASLRGGGIVGEHTLLFAGDDEQIAITHTATDRRVFARGAVLAALWTGGRAPGLYTMGDVLGLQVQERSSLYQPAQD